MQWHEEKSRFYGTNLQGYTESLTIDTPRVDSPLWALNGHDHNLNRPRGDVTQNLFGFEVFMTSGLVK